MRSVAIVVCFVLVACSSFAQSDRGTITGTISDPAGAVVAGAKIEVRNTQTEAQYETASTTTGNYTLAQLPAGAYQLTASVTGFKQYVRTGINVLVAQTLRIDIPLEVGNIAETVTVNADAPLLRTESSELSDNVKIDRVNDLPIVQVGGGSSGIRNPLAVTQLIPGSSWASNEYLRVNGTPNNTQALRIEGQDSSTGLYNGTPQMTAPSVDSIQEFSVQTSNYNAEFGQAGGAVFNTTMKSGTNSFHGSAYDYIVNEALNASTPYSNLKARMRRHDYGFTFGGPVWIPGVYDGHDKTFFFFNFEQFREKQISNNRPQTVPIAAYRNGDFSSILVGYPDHPIGTDQAGHPIYENEIYNPYTTQTVDGKTFRLPFMGCDGQHMNVICTDPGSPNYTPFDPVALKIQDYIPLPNQPVAQFPFTNNYLPIFESPSVTTIPAVKIDHQLSPKVKISGFYSHGYTESHNLILYGGADGLPYPLTAARDYYGPTDTIRLSLDDAITPTMLLHVGVGMIYYRFADDSPVTDFDTEKELGLTGTYGRGRFPYFPGMTQGSYGGMVGMGPMGQSNMVEERPTANASLTWVKSNHTVKLGAEMTLDGFPSTVFNNANGQFAISANQTALPVGQWLGGKSVGFPYASFLLGAVNNGSIALPAESHLGQQAWALFVQDSWKVTRKLTLDYGLRWDYQTYLTETYGRMSSFGLTTPNPKTDNIPGATVFEGYGEGRCNCDYAENYPYAFGPRFGAAYQINPKTVFRVGIGIVFSKAPNNDFATLGIYGNNMFRSPGLNQPAMWLKDGVPIVPVWPNYDPGQQPVYAGTIGTAPTLVDRNAGRPPRQIQWSIGFQREITKNLAVDVSYVGNRGVWWQANSLADINRLTPEILAANGLNISNAADRDLLMAPLFSQTRIAAPYPSFPVNETVGQALRPYPQFGAIPIRWAPLGNTWYDSLQVRVTKRFSHNFDFTYNFVWQKEFTLGSEEAASFGADVNDVLYRNLNKHISSFSQPIQSTLAATYTVPKWGSNKVLSWIVRDWQISAMLQYKSGRPIRVPSAQNMYSSQMMYNPGFMPNAFLNSLLGFGGPWADRVPGEPYFTKDLNCTSCFDPNQDFVLNPKAWADPSPGRIGYAAAYYDDYRFRRRPVENMSLGRIFRIKEGIDLNIRAEFTNIFNRIQPNNPSSGNALSTQVKDPVTGKPLGGFGYIDTGSAGAPRGGMIVARVTF